jgi:hypothetical protein
LSVDLTIFVVQHLDSTSTTPQQLASISQEFDAEFVVTEAILLSQ